MGVLNSAGPYITCQYQDYSSVDDVCIPMSSQQFAQVTSIFSVGGLIGSFPSSFIKDFKYITADDNDLELNDHPKQVIGWKEYLTNSKYKKSAMFVALILIGQQFCGINAIILYSTQVISDLSSKGPSRFANTS
ncbi:unnamed protein product [Hanseniaspora opuntiae]